MTALADVGARLPAVRTAAPTAGFRFPGPVISAVRKADGAIVARPRIVR
jgi:hypothetical protein